MPTEARRRPLSLGDAAAFATRLRARGARLVFTNGVFDIIHPGHIHYLTAARALGDALVVGVNSDRSVRANKGPERPINPEAERAEILLAFGVVDAVVLFDEDTPFETIRLLQPDVLVKGADWGPDAIVGSDLVKERGGEVVRMELTAGFSTTELITRVRRAVRVDP